MSERIHALAQQLFGKPSIEECTLQEVEQLANRYPYFAPAQFLLLQKYRQEQSPLYEQQLRKSVLYYHNPLEFEYFISSEKFYTNRPLLKEDIADVSEEETVKPALALPEEEEAPGVSDVSVADGPVADDTMVEDRSTNEEVAEEPSQEVTATVAPVTSEGPSSGEAAPVDHPDNTSYKPEPQPATPAEVVPVVPGSSEPVGDLTFEPYHTVDYFASQGIRPVLDEAPKDKFGKQLKSFTQWLKTMKRLPAADTVKQIDVTAENKVLDLANDSVHATEVATEAMAEVWLKQGNLEKARGIFEKLGLNEKYRDFDDFVAAKRRL